jgi:hypothetical protein
MDAVDRIPYMVEFAESNRRVNLTATVKWLKQYWI